MAARYGRKSDIIEIVKEIIEENNRVSAFDNPDYPIVTTDSDIQVYKWGLIPFWVKTDEQAQDMRKLTYNAKAETIFEKPSFREPIKSRRCIIPSTGFFEWRTEGKNKIPYFIHLKDEEIFSMAGIYDVWADKETGELRHTFSIITTQANGLMEYIHNTKKRMPVILKKDDEQNWLNPLLSKNEINSLLKPYLEKEMEAYIIKNDFGKSIIYNIWHRLNYIRKV